MTNWVLLRAAGIGGYLMLFLAIAWGLVATTSIVTARISKPSANLFHQFVATSGLALIGVHMGLLVIDRFMPFAPSDVLIPLHATYRPVATGLGVVAMYATVLIVVTSWLRKPIGVAWWRRIHLLAVPTFMLALAHGIFGGSDTERPWMVAMYAITGLSLVFLTLVRGFTYGYRPPRPPPPERARAKIAAKPERSASTVGS
jgi:sulfoxide reductase heme-binding subunit YedZ